MYFKFVQKHSFYASLCKENLNEIASLLADLRGTAFMLWCIRDLQTQTAQPQLNVVWARASICVPEDTHSHEASERYWDTWTGHPGPSIVTLHSKPRRVAGQHFLWPVQQTHLIVSGSMVLQIARGWNRETLSVHIDLLSNDDTCQTLISPQHQPLCVCDDQVLCSQYLNSWQQKA